MLREQRKRDLKEKIFIESIRLFSEKGFAHVSVSEITKACGIAKGTFYNYYPTKESVLLYLGQSQMELIANIPNDKEMTLKKKIMEMFVRLTSRYEEYPTLFKTAIAEMMRTTVVMDDEVNTIQRFNDLLASILKEEIECGRVEVLGQQDDVVCILVGTYFSSLMFWINNEQSVEVFTESMTRRISMILEQFIIETNQK
ncbi:TetR/AcrR family transcriptional regulator [Bacillus solimangrovi]|uniref:HTH tetR-type domain-containing protein n=1 Tax=Bacillus solimangrovi TaxID=1305675 RepID=A0A1E5LKC8_9BACI|nr:TetR/AcrR family transcriptional regulator [Bacillus solimangrovi]OEH94540.1 hypothetical protein BFG57_07675 [Bacillus solimangrovi]